MKKSWLVTLCVTSLFVFSGCNFGGGDDNNDNTPDATTYTDYANNPISGLHADAGTITENNDGTITYIDGSGVARNATSSAALAEYHTGLGYGETMFDSAHNKCQNCHNDLYDTWKNSMHAKSWSDGIFQSKFQDFLRTHIAKIGSTSDILYTETIFKGASKTCIKCHAPGAYYAGDWNITLTTLQAVADNATFQTALTSSQSNLASLTSTYDPDQPASVVGVSANGTLYQATYQIGHEANKEGINCATCHSIEQVKMIKDGDTYTLKDAMRSGPHGAVKAAAGTVLTFDKSATNSDMNKFFRLWGPELNSANATTGKMDVKSKDGRYTFGARLLHNSTQTVYTGGPFYGPFGATGTTNENSNDTSVREAHADFDTDTNNHFGNNGKALCLSCHQRSAGAFDGASTPTGFMELCSTWNAMSDVAGDNLTDDQNSPKCQKCHMEKIANKTVLHKWGQPNKLFTKAVNPNLTSHFDLESSVSATDNPVKGQWLNSHAFIGGSKIGLSDSYKAKIQSGFDATTDATLSGNTLTVTTTFTNKTAHMFPGAHPMRRVLSKMIVRDSANATISFSNATGTSTFGDITNTISTINGESVYGTNTVDVVYSATTNVDIVNKTANLSNTEVTSQKFDRTTITITAPDSTISSQSYVDGTGIQGTAYLNTIANDTDTTSFTRIYGHETGKNYTGTKAIRPGFDSNLVFGDNRLEPNETETYTVIYDVSNATSGEITIDNRIYYMQKGANGVFPINSNSTDTDTDGFLDSATNSAKKLLITEI